MPIIVMIAGTLIIWVIYWFVRMGGIDHSVSNPGSARTQPGVRRRANRSGRRR